MAEFAIMAGSGLLDLSNTPLADLSHLDEAVLEAAVDRLFQPCGGVNSTMAAIGGNVRMWQNYSTER
jgi:hypothetical protein